MVLLNLTLIDKEVDLDKFCRIHQKNEQFLFYVAKMILKNDSLAEDAVQEAFLRFIKNMHKVEEDNEPLTRGFLTAITRNVALTMLAKYQKDAPLSSEEIQKAVQMAEETVLEKKHTPEDYMLSQERLDQLKQAMSQLRQDHQDILQMVFLQEIKVGKAAKILGITGTVARKRLQRAKEELQEILRREGFDEYGPVS